MRASSWPSSRHCTSKGTRSSLSCTRTWGCCAARSASTRSEEHTSELQSQSNLVCRLLLEKKKITAHLLLIVVNASPVAHGSLTASRSRVIRNRLLGARYVLSPPVPSLARETSVLARRHPA